MNRPDGRLATRRYQNIYDKNDRKLYSMLFLTLAKQFKNKVIAPVDNAKIPKIDQANAIPL